MMARKKVLQLGLTFVGVLLIFITYVLYPKSIEKKSTTTFNEKNVVTVDEEEDNTFENVEYKGMYDFDKPFTVNSKQAYILTEKPDIVYMTDMRVTLYMSDGRIVVITSDEGSYNKNSHDCYFENNVKATDGKTIILSKNLDLLATKDLAKVYNDVVLTHEKSSLVADRLEYNFVTKNYHVSMFKSDKKVKIKLIE